MRRLICILVSIFAGGSLAMAASQNASTANGPQREFTPRSIVLRSEL